MQYMRLLAKEARRINSVATFCKNVGIGPITHQRGLIHSFHSKSSRFLSRNASFTYKSPKPIIKYRNIFTQYVHDYSRGLSTFSGRYVYYLSGIGKKYGHSRGMSSLGGKLEDSKLSTRAKLVSYGKLMRCHTLVPVVIIGIPVMWSAVLALPPVVTLVEIKKIALLALGTLFTRFAGCCVNDLADAKIDRRVARTKSRPLAAREITYKEALGTLALNASIALGILLQFDINTIRLGCLGALMASVYPFLKRFTNYPQVFLGASLAIGTLMAWTSISLGPITLAPLCIYGTACMWTIIYDTVYAHQDKEYDKLIGVKSLAIHWGDDTRKMCRIMAYNMTLLMTACGYIAHLSAPFYLSTVLSHIWMQREIKRVNLSDPVDCLGFFKRNTIYGGILLAGILAGKGGLEISLDSLSANV